MRKPRPQSPRASFHQASPRRGCREASGSSGRAGPRVAASASRRPDRRRPCFTPHASPNARTREFPHGRRYLVVVVGSVAWVDLAGQTPFLRAAAAGDITVMRLLLEHGADPSIATNGGTTPLMVAAGVNWAVDE